MKPSRSQFVASTAALVASPRTVRAQAREKIRVGGVPSDDITPILYAVEHGLYQKAGLEVEYVPTSSGTFATTAVIAGEYEMGKGGLVASLVAHLRGLPLKVAANAGVWDPTAPFTLFFVAADSPIRTGADLNGKVAAVSGLNDLNTLALSMWVDKNGGDSKTMKFLEIPNSAIANALAEHRIDVGGLNEPELTAAREAGKVRVLAPCFSAIAPRFVVTLFFSNRDWAAKHPDALNRWVRTTYQAAAYTNAHRGETVEMLSTMTKIPPDVIRKTSRVTCATSSDPGLLQPVIDAGAKYGTISADFRAAELFT
jgi:NitT/TauT family transport system substrate-binding protein